MKMFIGHVDAKLDAKGRAFVPAQFRKVLGGETSLVCRIDPSGRYLTVAREDDWQRKVEQVMQELDEWDADAQDALQQLTGEADYLEVDGQGRILIPKRVMEKLSFGSELEMVGMGDKFAIWNRSSYEEFMEKRGTLSEELKKIRQ